MPKNTGKIIIPPMTDPPKPHELHTAQVFAGFGHMVEFVKPSYLPGARNGDMIFDGKKNEIWEVKAPTGRSRRNTFHNLFRTAKGQSKNLIIDLYRAKMPDEVCLNRIENEFKNYRSIKRMKVITRNNSMVEKERIVDFRR